ncbi:hypothetical protein K438DRAFT_1974675 [Mycena galopus ATCC 62051]|nr:hypothetical protein K438DRAFT_1974675 [Mycena galopus ATCC 62051]
MASELMDWPTKYTNRKYPKFFWTRMLRELSPATFKMREQADREEAQTAREATDGEEQETSLEATFDEDEDTIMLNEYALLSDLENSTDVQDEKQKSNLFYDVFCRPDTLKELCAWEIFSKYEKRPLPKSKKSYKEFKRFAPSHPQYATHCLKKLTDTEEERIPVLVGIPIPRADEEDNTSHKMAMLALFKPWTQNAKTPLKEDRDT